MIHKLEVSGLHGTDSIKLKDYVTEKMNKLERFIPRHARESAHFEIKFMEAHPKRDHAYSAECVVHLPGADLSAHETANSPFEAVDMLENKLRQQFLKYKDHHIRARLVRMHTTKQMPAG